MYIILYCRKGILYLDLKHTNIVILEVRWPLNLGCTPPLMDIRLSIYIILSDNVLLGLTLIAAGS